MNIDQSSFLGVETSGTCYSTEFHTSDILSTLYLQYDRGDQYAITAAVSDSSDKSKDPKDQKVMVSKSGTLL